MFHQIQGCDQTIASAHFKHGLESKSPVFADLMLQPPKDMDNLMECITKYIEFEEVLTKQDTPSTTSTTPKVIHVSCSYKKAVNTIKMGHERTLKASDFIANRIVFMSRFTCSSRRMRMRHSFSGRTTSLELMTKRRIRGCTARTTKSRDILKDSYYGREP